MKIDFGKQRSKRVLLLAGILALFGVALEAQALLTIDKSMEIAVDNSPDMQQTELSLVRSQERLNAQRARLKSQFSACQLYSGWLSNQPLRSADQ